MNFEKDKIFEKELQFIVDENIRYSAREMINLLPDYFFEIEASSTGKYHPEFTLGKRGLVRHVKVAVKFAIELFNIYKFDQKTKDLIIFALLIHDGLKKGKEESRYTKFNHSVLIGEYLRENKDKLKISNEDLERVIKMDASHMGKWNTSEYEPGVVLPIPQTVEEKFVHMCDYLASRKCINVRFDNENNILE